MSTITTQLDKIIRFTIYCESHEDGSERVVVSAESTDRYLAKDVAKHIRFLQAKQEVIDTIEFQELT